MEKIVLITRPTRLDALIEKFNTKPQAKFYIEHLGADFTDYEEEHDTYYRELDALKSVVQEFGHMQVLDWKHLSNYIFGAKDLVITIGQDGLVANTLKYLDQQLLIGFNSDFDRWDGILSRFHTGQARDVITRALRHRAKVYGVTKAKVELSDQQVLYAVNDFFIGVNNHSSARYEISYGGKRENQSSSGVIVSTPLGSSGWMRSILRGAKGISQSIDDTKGSWRDSAKQRWNDDVLHFAVREPLPSNYTETSIVYGKVTKQKPLCIESKMGERGIIFSDGVQEDYLSFNYSVKATITLAKDKGHLVVG